MGLKSSLMQKASNLVSQHFPGKGGWCRNFQKEKLSPKICIFLCRLM